MKRIVETTSSILLVDPTYGDIIWEDRPCVVRWSSFFEARTGAGQIRVLHADLPEEATDAEFAAFLQDAEDVDLAIASFVSKFVEDEAEPSERGKLEARAAELGVTFRSNISDEKLAEKIAAAEAKTKG